MQDWFVPDHTLAVYFGQARFDKVLKMKDGQYKPFLGDILQAKKDCDDLRECFEKYSI